MRSVYDVMITEANFSCTCFCSDVRSISRKMAYNRLRIFCFLNDTGNNCLI